MKNDIILTLYQRPETVFSLKEISLIFPDIAYDNLKRRMSYYIKTGKFQRVRKGMYAQKDYNSLELAGKLYTPSYVSLETVLEKEGIIFQKYSTIFVISYLTRKINVSGQDISYRKIKDEILLNQTGIEEYIGYFMATKERAFLDALFLYRDYHFDNLKPLEWNKVMSLAKIYESKILKKRIAEYYQIYEKEHV